MHAFDSGGSTIWVRNIDAYNASCNTVRLIANSNGNIDTMVKTMSILAGPAIPTITQSSNLLTSSYDSSNQWYYEGDPIFLALSKDYEITLEGNYTVTYTDSNGCNRMSEPIYAAFDGIETSYPVNTPCWIKSLHGDFLGLNRCDISNTMDNGYIICATGSFDSILGCKHRWEN